MKYTKAIFLISRIRERANKFILAELAGQGITSLVPSHGDILMCLYQKERVTMKEIADTIYRTKPTVTVLVNKLAEQGLVRKVPCSEDSRVMYVELTKDGQKLQAIFEEVSAELQQRLFRDLDRKDRKQLEGYLKIILRNLE